MVRHTRPFVAAIDSQCYPSSMLIKFGLFALTFLTASAGTLFTLRYALQRQLIDRPGARSSHRHPTPRGGGLAIVTRRPRAG